MRDPSQTEAQIRKEENEIEVDIVRRIRNAKKVNKDDSKRKSVYWENESRKRSKIRRWKKRFAKSETIRLLVRLS